MKETNNTRRLALEASAEECRSERFASMCECTEVKIEGKASEEAALVYTLLAYTADGKEFTVYEKPITPSGDGKIAFVHEFDPVSLAVYQGSKEYCVRIRDRGQGSFGLHVSVTENMQIAEGIKAVAKRRHQTARTPHPLGKVLFVGNSILLGMELNYGMCASSPEHDYAYHVTREIQKTSPDCQFFKFYGSFIEHAESIEAFENVYGVENNQYTGKPFCESLTEDLDLVILQLTDNVNTEKKLETFSVTAELLLQRIRQKCPHAVILWAYGWFHKRAFFPRLLELCEQYGVEQADLRGCRTQSNEAVSGQQYLSKNGEKKTVSDTWITHPGDGGMRAIADKIIEVLREAAVLP